MSHLRYRYTTDKTTNHENNLSPPTTLTTRTPQLVSRYISYEELDENYKLARSELQEFELRVIAGHLKKQNFSRNAQHRILDFFERNLNCKAHKVAQGFVSVSPKEFPAQKEQDFINNTLRLLRETSQQIQHGLRQESVSRTSSLGNSPQTPFSDSAQPFSVSGLDELFFRPSSRQSGSSSPVRASSATLGLAPRTLSVSFDAADSANSHLPHPQRRPSSAASGRRSVPVYPLKAIEFDKGAALNKLRAWAYRYGKHFKDCSDCQSLQEVKDLLIRDSGVEQWTIFLQATFQEFADYISFYLVQRSSESLFEALQKCSPEITFPEFTDLEAFFRSYPSFVANPLVAIAEMIRNINENLTVNRELTARDATVYKVFLAYIKKYISLENLSEFNIAFIESAHAALREWTYEHVKTFRDFSKYQSLQEVKDVLTSSSKGDQWARLLQVACRELVDYLSPLREQSQVFFLAAIRKFCPDASEADCQGLQAFFEQRQIQLGAQISDTMIMDMINAIDLNTAHPQVSKILLAFIKKHPEFQFLENWSRLDSLYEVRMRYSKTNHTLYEEIDESGLDIDEGSLSAPASREEYVQKLRHLPERLLTTGCNLQLKSYHPMDRFVQGMVLDSFPLDMVSGGIAIEEDDSNHQPVPELPIFSKESSAVSERSKAHESSAGVSEQSVAHEALSVRAKLSIVDYRVLRYSPAMKLLGHADKIQLRDLLASAGQDIALEGLPSLVVLDVVGIEGERQDTTTEFVPLQCCVVVRYTYEAKSIISPFCNFTVQQIHQACQEASSFEAFCARFHVSAALFDQYLRSLNGLIANINNRLDNFDALKALDSGEAPGIFGERYTQKIGGLSNRVIRAKPSFEVRAANPEEAQMVTQLLTSHQSDRPRLRTARQAIMEKYRELKTLSKISPSLARCASSFVVRYETLYAEALNQSLLANSQVTLTPSPYPLAEGLMTSAAGGGQKLGIGDTISGLIVNSPRPLTLPLFFRKRSLAAAIADGKNYGNFFTKEQELQCETFKNLVSLYPKIPARGDAAFLKGFLLDCIALIKMKETRDLTFKIQCIIAFHEVIMYKTQNEEGEWKYHLPTRLRDTLLQELKQAVLDLLSDQELFRAAPEEFAKAISYFASEMWKPNSLLCQAMSQSTGFGYLPSSWTFCRYRFYAGDQKLTMATSTADFIPHLKQMLNVLLILEQQEELSFQHLKRDQKFQEKMGLLKKAQTDLARIKPFKPWYFTWWGAGLIFLIATAITLLTAGKFLIAAPVAFAAATSAKAFFIGLASAYGASLSALSVGTILFLVFSPFIITYGLICGTHGITNFFTKKKKETKVYNDESSVASLTSSGKSTPVASIEEKKAALVFYDSKVDHSERLLARPQLTSSLTTSTGQRCVTVIDQPQSRHVGVATILGSSQTQSHSKSSELSSLKRGEKAKHPMSCGALALMYNHQRQAQAADHSLLLRL